MRYFPLLFLALPILADHALTNADVIALVKAGLTAPVIEEKISASTVAFDVSTDSLVALSKAGVPQSVIKAMITASTHAPAATPPAPAAPAAPARPPHTFDIKLIATYDTCLGTLEISASQVAIRCDWRYSREHSAFTFTPSNIAKHCYYRSKVGLGKNWLFVTTDTKPEFYEIDGRDMDEAFRFFRELNPSIPSSANCSLRDLRTEF